MVSLQKLNQQVRRAKAFLLHPYIEIKHIKIKFMSLMSSFKGILGETVINVATWIMLDKEVYHRLNNITLPLSNGGSTQIDHVIVSMYGIFVIETKNYKGWIFGKEKQAQWTQMIMGRKYKFQNPLRQNYLHIKTLSDLLELDTCYLHSMVVFIGECEIKTCDELPEHVLKGGVVSYIKKKQDKILTEEEVQSIVEQIKEQRFAKSWRTNKQHKAYLKDKHVEAGKKPNTKQSNGSSTKKNPNQSPQPKVQETIKTREVHRWSGQTEVKETELPIIQPTNDDSVYITPFAILVSESGTNELALTEQTDEPVVSSAIPTCPKCNSEMIERVAKKGQRQGQAFFGCSKFPKCRGVVNIS